MRLFLASLLFALASSMKKSLVTSEERASKRAATIAREEQDEFKLNLDTIPQDFLSEIMSHTAE